MSRKTKTVVINTEKSRDNGRQYLITEMPASRAEKWAIRAFLAIARSGIDIPEDVAKAGMAGIAIVGMRAIALGGVYFQEIEPLIDEMFSCVQFISDPSRPEQPRFLIEDDIDEIATRLQLRKEIFDLHVEFFPVENLSKLTT